MCTLRQRQTDIYEQRKTDIERERERESVCVCVSDSFKADMTL